MKNINELIGLIEGINFDNIINAKEVKGLENCLDQCRDLIFDKEYGEFIKVIDDAIEDHVINEEERIRLMSYINKYADESRKYTEKIYELNGIISGIISDNVVNEAEIYRLKDWMVDNGEFVKKYKSSVEIADAIADILDDGIVTQEEQDELLKKLKTIILDSQFALKLNYLCNKIKHRKNIGVDLIDIIDDPNAISKIHNLSETQLLDSLGYGIYSVLDPEIVIVSLVLIALMEYNGSFWNSVYSTYPTLSANFSAQQIMGIIHSILNRYRTAEEIENNERYINVILANAIVPRNYLPAFFDFIYDIYKLNFHYSIPQDPYDDFLFVYHGLRENMMSSGDEVSVDVTRKTYKLIRSTKRLITRGQDLSSVIDLSIIVMKLIDRRMWSNEVTVHNPYLKKAYEVWESSLDKSSSTEKKRMSSEFKSRWKPKFNLENDQIFLTPPVHRIKSIYDPKQIKVIVTNNGRMLYKEDRPFIRAIFGGYELILKKLPIRVPLGELRYQILSDDEIIYDSGKSLYRSALVFNDHGNEIQEGTNYNGVAIFCYNDPTAELKPYLNTGEYRLAALNVNQGDSFLINGKLISFAASEIEGIFGDRLDDHHIRQLNTNVAIDVYNNVRLLIFEGHRDASDFNIIINGVTHDLSEFQYSTSVINGSTRFMISLDTLEPGIYSIKVRSDSMDQYSNKATYNFAYDPGFKAESKSLNDEIYIVSVESSFLTEDFYEEISVQNYSPDFIKFIYRGYQYVYEIPFRFNFYKLIDDNKWHPFTDDLWIKNISSGDKIQISNAGLDLMRVYGIDDVLLEEISLQKNGIICEAPIGFLHSYKMSNKYCKLSFVMGNRVVDEIYCYNQCVIDCHETVVEFDNANNSLEISVSYHGEGSIYAEVTDPHGQNIYTSDRLSNDERLIVEGFEEPGKYQICFVEKAGGLLIGEIKKILKKYNRIFFPESELENSVYRIEEVHYSRYYNKKFHDKRCLFNNNMFIRFLGKISAKKYQGEILYRCKYGDLKLERLNPVEIEVCSDIINGDIECYVTKDRDGLLLDEKNKRIMDTLDDPDAPDIMLYTINVMGECY